MLGYVSWEMTLYGCHSFMYCRASITPSDFNGNRPMYLRVVQSMSQWAKGQRRSHYALITQSKRTSQGEEKDLPQNKTERDGFFTSEVTNGGSLRRNDASMSCPSVFTLIRSHERFFFLSAWHLGVSYLLKSSAGKLNCQPSRLQFFSPNICFVRGCLRRLVLYCEL